MAVDGSTMQATAGSPLGATRQYVALAINPITNEIYAIDGANATVAVLR